MDLPRVARALQKGLSPDHRGSLLLLHHKMSSSFIATLGPCFSRPMRRLEEKRSEKLPLETSLESNKCQNVLVVSIYRFKGYLSA